MVSSQNQLGVTLTARDQITATLKKVEEHTRRLDGAFGSLGNRLKTGIQWHILNNGLNMLDRAFRRLVDTIPDLIQRGEQWASVVDDITDATGMSAAKASELAGVQKLLTGSADGLTVAFKAMAKSVTENQDAWKTYGVQIARNKDGSVDAYRTFQNLRQAVSATGASTLSFAAAQKLAGKGAKDLLDLLTLTNDQWRAYSDQARKSGLILTEAGAKAAEQWGRTKNLLDSAFTGIGSQILQGVAPTLIGLTNAVTEVIQRNMANIVRFVSGAIAFVAGMISQFLGVDLDINLIAQLDGAGRAAEKTGPKLRQHAADAKRASEAQRDLTASTRALRDAQRELAAARSDMPFHGDMSDADYILARQARSARIAAAQERIEDAKKALSEHRKVMGQMETINSTALRHMGGQWKRYSGGGGPVVDGLKETLADAKGFGRQIADAIQDAIFGPDTQIQLGGGKPITVRSGGLVGGLGKVQEAMQRVGDILGPIVDKLGLIQGYYNAILTPFQQAAAGLQTAAGLLESAQKLLQRLYDSLPGWLIGERNPSRPQYNGWRSDGPDSPPPGSRWTSRSGHASKPAGNGYWQPNADGGGFTWIEPGAGVSGAMAGINALGEIERSLGVGGTAVGLLERVESAIFGVQDAIDNLDLGGGGGGVGGATIASRVTTLERQMTGVDDSALKTANQRQDKAIRGVTNVNANQGDDLRDHEGRIKALANWRDGKAGQGPGRAAIRAQGDVIDNIVDVLRGHGWWGTNPDRQSAGRTAGERTVVNVYLDSKRVARAMGATGRTTSLKPVS